MDPKLEKRNSEFADPRAIPGRPVKDFTDLQPRKLARELRQRVYTSAGTFPAEEKLVPRAQLRGAAIPVTANLAEGYGRFSYQENLLYPRQARGSAYEVRDHLTTALDAGYLSQKEWKARDELAQRVIQLLNGYVRSTRARQAADAR